MQRWFVSSNCQTTGLANSFQLLLDGVEVHSADIWQFRDNLEACLSTLGDYDHVVVGPEVRSLIPDHLAHQHDVRVIPQINFEAYHPDLTYVFKDGVPFKGPIDDYHSLLAFAGHRAGVGVDRTLEFFNGRSYREFGYLDRWAADRDALIAACRDFGLDVSLAVRRWGRSHAFMHSVNHPKIDVITDLARLYVETQGIRPNDATMVPHDNLMHGPCFPVYPEVGEALGVPGEYRFKPPQTYSRMGLRDFVERSFAVYDMVPLNTLSVWDNRMALLDNMVGKMRGATA